MKKITLLFSILIFVMSVQLSFAAPSLTIIKPPVTPVPSWTGPGIPLPPLAPIGDPHAELGQWFVDKLTGEYENRTHEFYDNVHPDFGGGYASFFAIYGYVSLVVGGGGAPILAFDIVATISNDIPAQSPWLTGNNSHGEQRVFTNMADQKFEGPLLDVKLTAEFSIDPTIPFPTPFLPPYFDPYPGVYIEALNHDQLAWYCWTQDDPEAPLPSGDFHVPTWDFDDIPMGASATRVLSFSIPAGMMPADPRYAVIESSFATGDDVLLNRTTSLKISDWIEVLVGDTGLPYPEPEHSSDVSVFHNVPEPGIFAGISLIILGIYRRIK